MTWLLTGGAGYIGSHIARALGQAGMDVVVLDDLSSGFRENVADGVPFVEATLLDTAAVARALRDHDVTGVVHLAAKKAVGESVEKPLMYWQQNVEGTRSLLEACTDVGVERVLFSSSAAVYGTPDLDLVTEDAPPRPINPYGETKLIGEWMLRDLARATKIGWVSLRYFNVAGAGAPDLGDRGVFNLIPLVFRALSSGVPPQVFGADYPTPDGTCVRDYIHVVDLADAHVTAARALEAGPQAATYNVGRGEGASVKEVLDVVRAVTGRDFEAEVVDRRPGDPARLVAAVDAIERDLGWTADRDLRDMVSSAWEAWQSRA
ncbi:MAG: UDP-glucose 4-epimerase GalE [Actinomycetes bacterium]